MLSFCESGFMSEIVTSAGYIWFIALGSVLALPLRKSYTDGSAAPATLAAHPGRLSSAIAQRISLLPYARCWRGDPIRAWLPTCNWLSCNRDSFVRVYQGNKIKTIAPPLLFWLPVSRPRSSAKSLAVHDTGSGERDAAARPAGAWLGYAYSRVWFGVG